MTPALLTRIAAARLLFRRADIVQQPFSIEFGMPVIRDPSDGAQRAGLERGDIVLSLNGRPFTAMLQIRDQVRSMRPGQSFRIEYIRPAAATRKWQSAEKSGLPARMAVWPSVAMPPLTGWTTTLNLFFFFALEYLRISRDVLKDVVVTDNETCIKSRIVNSFEALLGHARHCPNCNED